MTKSCINCHKDFWAHHTHNKCCSQLCAHNLKKTQVTHTCFICGESFQEKRSVKRKTCSRACANKYLSQIHKGIKLWKVRVNVIRGEKHYAWKGGITPELVKARNSTTYKRWREAVFSRDDWTCQECQTRGGYLEADHIKPFSLFPNLRFETSNGQTLCKECHKKTPTYGFKIRKYCDGTAGILFVDSFTVT